MSQKKHKSALWGKLEPHFPKSISLLNLIYDLTISSKNDLLRTLKPFGGICFEEIDLTTSDKYHWFSAIKISPSVIIAFPYSNTRGTKDCTSCERSIAVYVKRTISYDYVNNLLLTVCELFIKDYLELERKRNN